MNNSDLLLEELSIKPLYILIFSCFFFMGLVSGIIYSIIKGSILGLALDLILVALLCISVIYSNITKQKYYIPLAVACFGCSIIFTTDIVLSILNKNQYTSFQVPLDIAIIVV